MLEFELEVEFRLRLLAVVLVHSRQQRHKQLIGSLLNLFQRVYDAVNAVVHVREVHHVAVTSRRFLSVVESILLPLELELPVLVTILQIPQYIRYRTGRGTSVVVHGNV